MHRQSVALSITRSRRPHHLLVVLRPHDDADLPDAWGLPAASLQAEESWEDAARRAARDKLGVAVNVGRLLHRGALERPWGFLEMRLYAATLIDGEPHVPQTVPGVTQYQSWRWSPPDILEAAAARGSLCCRLQLEMTRNNPQAH